MDPALVIPLHTAILTYCQTLVVNSFAAPSPDLTSIAIPNRLESRSSHKSALNETWAPTPEGEIFQYQVLWGLQP